MPCNCGRNAGAHSHFGDPNFTRDGAVAFGQSLNHTIDVPKLQCWNVANPDVLPAVFDQLQVSTSTTGSPTSAAAPASSGNSNIVVLKSDADEELLVFVPFSEFARIRGISVTGTGDATFAPGKLRLYVNRSDVTGFDSIRRLQHQDEIQLANASPDDQVIYRLDAVKFMNCSNVVLFFPETISGDGDECHVTSIQFFGEPTGRVVNRPLATNVTYESRGNPADHDVREEDRKMHFIS